MQSSGKPLTPKDDPEFWDRPSELPPGLKNKNFLQLYEDGILLFRGPVAKNTETGTLYYYIDEEWTTDAPEEEHA